MSKIKTLYVCQNCSYTSAQWVGQCPGCGSWNTFAEEVQISSVARPSGSGKPGRNVQPVQLSTFATKSPKRISSNIEEFDRVLGGGFVPGQVILLGGEPGVGKSTLLTEIAKNMKGTNIMYVCGEESIDQIKLRTVRMEYPADNLYMLGETDVDTIINVMQTNKEITLVIVDSIQTLTSQELPGVAGSLTQVRGCSQLLTNTAKSTGVPIVLVGHVTKEGVVAGPKVLEHIVDTVLFLEGDSQHMYRILRTDKNRFGPVSEVGIFEMTEKSMMQVANPSELFLGQMLKKSSGSCITVVMEGQRPLLFEVQALCVRTAFGYPRRTASGYNVNRLQVLIALLEKRCNLNLSGHDVYLSIAGGFKVSEYASDLAVCLAIASSLKDVPLKPKTAAFGECGLNGEVRKVPHQEKRIKEAKKLGYTNVVNSDEIKSLKEAVDLLIK
ncbi:DNA repair protein RadA [candidate division WWE3 bacterium RIFOXYD1_FULL_39_9]|uniref:DNA repair protein RadA n=1 Tax=candidate division WWE3 bacterium RIFOXYD1_FULL_39_9 TaxID=1802649 RepID=A0A1F4X5R8_UNCKA|nr:MAG: DNA repair protein RadA [candidate division WWE3 bacterium RIFOXYD1_FULL_39_9]